MLMGKLKRHFKLIVVVGLLIFLHYTRILAPVERLLVKAGQPLYSKFYEWSSSSRAKYDARVNKLDKDARISDLERQLSELTVANAKMQELEGENQKLREYLNFFDTQKLNYLLARVTAQENFLDAAKYGQNIVINRGQKDGVVPGLAVINSSGVVVGKVLAVADNSSRVCLLTNNTCKLAVSILNQNRTIGVTEGDLGLTVKINFVGQTEKINPEEIVVTSGLETSIPAGLVVGRVSQIDNNQNDVWQNINVEPLVNFDNLGVVSVVLP